MDTMDGTRARKVLKYLHQTVPRNIPRSSVRALEKLPAQLLSTLHAGSDLRQFTDDPQLRRWLTANPVPLPQASVQDPLFRGTVFFVRVTFIRPNQPNFVMRAAAMHAPV